MTERKSAPFKPFVGDLRDTILKGFAAAGGAGGIAGYLDKVAKDHPRLAKQARDLKRRVALMEGQNGSS
jgi:hypothetical protein